MDACELPEKKFIDNSNDENERMINKVLLLGAIDWGSKFILYKLVPQFSADQVVRLLNELLVEFNSLKYVRILKTDNGSIFNAAETEQWCFDHGVEHHNGKPYCPQD